MKRLTLALLLLALLFTAAGCGRIIKNDYRSVEPHSEPSGGAQAQPQEEQIPVVGNRNELRGNVLSFVRSWTELGTLRVRGYDGDISADLAETINYITKEDPTGAYALDYADAELTGSAAEGTIEVRLVFRRSAAEIDSIVTVSGHADADGKIRAALANFDSALTLRIRNYEEADFAEEIRSYCLCNPALTPVLPEVSASVYPQEGQTRILELHFTYAATRDEMRLMRSAMETLLTSASAYIRSGEDDTERLSLLLRYLVVSRSYAPLEGETDRPAYQLLRERQADSLAFASAVCAVCRQAGIDCELIEGTRGGEPWAWNRIRMGGESCEVDFMRAELLDETELTLLTPELLAEEEYLAQESGN